MSYLQQNKGFLTASKLKCFIRNPEEYKLKYIDEIELDWEDKRCFVLGNAFDTLMSYGREVFDEKFYIDDGLVVDELKEKLIQRWEDPKEVKSMKLPELRALYYDDESKIRLTPAEGRDVVGMYREAMRQPILDLGGNYTKQHLIESTYDGLPIRGTLDRFDLERWIIRDWKTSGRLDNFAYDMENTFDYILSMAFYYVLAYAKYGKECDVYLDVLSKQSPYTSVVYKLDKNRLLEKVENTIIPALDFYKICQKNNRRPAVNWVTQVPLSRFDIMKSDYYHLMDSWIATEAVTPYEY